MKIYHFSLTFSLFQLLLQGAAIKALDCSLTICESLHTTLFTFFLISIWINPCKASPFTPSSVKKDAWSLFHSIWCTMVDRFCKQQTLLVWLFPSGSWLSPLSLSSGSPKYYLPQQAPSPSRSTGFSFKNLLSSHTRISCPSLRMPQHQLTLPLPSFLGRYSLATLLLLW